MKLCPYCGKAVLEKALACKHCGEWLEDISDYLEKKGSVYAHSDSMSAPIINTGGNSNQIKKEKKLTCVFCEFPRTLDEDEIRAKEFVCGECKKKNFVTSDRIDDVIRNITAGWGWLLLTAYFVLAIQKYLFTLDDILQMAITFTLSLSLLLYLYFELRKYILKEKFRKKRFFGMIYGASLISGAVSTAGVVLFVFTLHLVYPYTGLQSDKRETNMKILYYKSQINKISEKQKEINDVISKPHTQEHEIKNKISLLDNYISLNNEEKKYIDSIYSTLGESDYYTGINENKKKIVEANLLINKIIAYKTMSAHNLKNYYMSGNENAFKAVQDLNKEIAALNKEYSAKYSDLMVED
jgi:hypothetical protein